MNLYLSDPRIASFARVELRYATIKLKDGLSGTAAVNNMGGYMAGASTIAIDTVVTNTDDGDNIPTGARVTFDSDSTETVYTVTSGGTSTITISPALADAVDADDDITVLPQEVEIKVGDGDLQWTETKNYSYDLDRGNLDVVRQLDEAPVEVQLSFTFEKIRTGTAEVVSPMDALKGIGGASTWISADSDACQPYAVTLEVSYEPPCSGAQIEIVTFTPFRHEQAEMSYRDATISISGKCNATEPTVSRVNA
jgi:hypothetical protein